MRVSKSQSANNYANFIQEVYELTHKAPTRVPIHMLAKKYRISQMTSIMLQNSGSLRRGKINTYRWIGPAPTPEFIEHVHSTVLSYHREITRKNRSAQMKDQVKLDLAPETKPHAVVSPTTKSKKKQRTFSFLWGAIKFSY